MADIRTMPINVEATRDSTTNEMKVQGYALEFNKPSQPLPFVEYIEPQALDDVDLSDVLLLFGHEYNSILAKTTAGTLSLKVDENGLWFSATLPDTSLGHDTYNNILNGNLSGMSFGFNIAEDDWTVDLDTNNTIHTIQKIESISEISVTPIPAYSQTSIEVTRSLEKFKKQSKRSNQTMDNQALIDAFTAFLESQKPVEAPETEPEVDVDETSIEPADETPVDDEPVEPTDEPADEQPEPAKDTEKRDEADDEPEIDEEDSTDGEKPEPKIEPKKENKRSKENTQMGTIISQPKISEEVRSFKSFLKGEKRDANSAFTTVDGGAIIPSEVLAAYKAPADANLLSGLVNRIQVSAPTGKLPVLAKASARLTSAQEGIDNPAIGKAQLSAVNYDVVTYRGQLPITLEMTSDFDGITALLAQYVQDVVAQTEQYGIGAVLQKATPVSATSVDDIKQAFNTGLTNYSDKSFVVTESFYNSIDTAKDAQGRYLLQDSIASATGKTLLGAPLVVVEDDVLGGGSKAFIGSVKSFALEAVKDNVSVQWQRNEDFTTNLGAALRADFQVADAQAGKFITFAPVQAPAGK